MESSLSSGGLDFMILYTVSMSLFNSKTIVHIACFIPCWKLEYQNIKDRLLRGSTVTSSNTCKKKKWNHKLWADICNENYKYSWNTWKFLKYMKPGHFKRPAPKDWWEIQRTISQFSGFGTLGRSCNTLIPVSKVGIWIFTLE